MAELEAELMANELERNLGANRFTESVNIVIPQNKKEKLVIGWMTILTNKSCMFAILVCFIGTYDTVFWTGFISTELKNSYDISDDKIGYVFAI